MRGKYSLERKIQAAKSAIKLNESGERMEDISVTFDIPYKTLDSWVRDFKAGKLKLPEPPVKENKTQAWAPVDFGPVVEKLSELIEHQKQTNIRIDGVYALIKEGNDIKELSNKLAGSDG